MKYTLTIVSLSGNRVGIVLQGLDGREMLNFSAHESLRESLTAVIEEACKILIQGVTASAY